MRVMEREENLERHTHNEKYAIIPQTHRVEGWDDLVVFTGHSREHLQKWIKLEGLPAPRRNWVKTGTRGVWRKRPIWDKREIGDWFANGRGRVF